MSKGKIVALAAIGVAAVLLLSTDKGKKIRKQIAEASEDWSETLGELADKAVCSAKDLKKLVSKEIKGLSSDAREKITNIIDEGSKRAKKLRKEVAEAVETEVG
ncbi:MAG: YtxH domain-containing protein [Chitinophagaceae bacterium]